MNNTTDKWAQDEVTLDQVMNMVNSALDEKDKKIKELEQTIYEIGMVINDMGLNKSQKEKLDSIRDYFEKK